MKRLTAAAAELAEILRHASPDTAGLNAGKVAELSPAASPHASPLAGTGPSEHDEQVALFAWASMNEVAHPELSMLHATPNGGYRPAYTAAMMKLEGQKAGYPDISLDVARGKWYGLRIELKRKPNKPTPTQLEWIDRLKYYGYQAVVCYSANEAINCIMAYLAQE